jgi:putative glutamine amidotransferase
MVPALEGLDIAALSSTLDGLLLPGSLSNVNPERYRAQQSSDAAPYDLQRDALVWPLVDALVAKGKPLFGICRGMQELNAIWGGSLCPRLAPLDVAVNSLHWQGVARLGAGLQVEARAPDGLIEAFHATDVPGFVFGVQWHPEVAPERDPYSAALFRRFGQALAAAA